MISRWCYEMIERGEVCDKLYPVCNYTDCGLQSQTCTNVSYTCQQLGKESTTCVTQRSAFCSGDWQQCYLIKCQTARVYDAQDNLWITAWTEWNLCTHKHKTQRLFHLYCTCWMHLLDSLSFLIDDIRKTVLSYVCLCICVCVCVREGNRNWGKSHPSNILFTCLSFIHCLRSIFRETFSHFKNSPAISEIIGQLLVLSRLHVQ